MRLLLIGGVVGVVALVAALAYAYRNRDDAAEGVLWRSLLTALASVVITAAVVGVVALVVAVAGRLD